MLLLTFLMLWLLLSNMLKLFVQDQSNIWHNRKDNLSGCLIFLSFLLNVVYIVIVGSFFVATDEALKQEGATYGPQRLQF